MSQQRDVWVELNDIDPDGCVVTYADMAEPGVDLSVGARVIAGDDEGNLVAATVVRRDRRGSGAVTLRLHLETFTPTGADASALHAS